MRILSIVFIVLLVTGCSAKPYAVRHKETFSGHGEYDVYVVSHGWHTGIVISTTQIQNVIPELGRRFGNVQYLEFGWGDQGFYQAGEITSALTLRAIFWPTESVMHVVAVPVKPAEYFPDSEVGKVDLNHAELSSLMQFISDSFYRDSDGQLLLLKNGLYGDSQFYKAMGDYYLMNTCNKWTAKGLKSTGMDIWPLFKLTAGSVMSYVREYNHDLRTNVKTYFPEASVFSGKSY